MNKKFIILSFLSLGSFTSFAQITIEDCYSKAQSNYPLIKQYDLIEKTRDYNLSNANKGYLPQIMFSAKASYQSDVTELPIDLSQLGVQGMNIPAVRKDQYGATLDVSQSVWDGGAIQAQKEGYRSVAEMDKKSVEVSLYSINERVNQLFFGILLADAQLSQNQLLQDELQRNYEQVDSYMKNGIANQSDLDAIKVDQLRTMQNHIRFVNTKKAYVEIMSKLIGEELNADTEFVRPEPIRPATNEVHRPELALYDAQIQNLESQNKQITSGLMPKFGLFVTGGYGNPSLNMLRDEFRAYYIGGVKLTWNIGNFYNSKNSRKKILTNKNSVETQRETFLFNTSLDIIQKDKMITDYNDQLRYDDEIIALRNSVKRASEAKMANGTLSGTDLTRDINAEQMAIQDKILHETQLLLAIYNLKFATNN